jgi:NADPH:quinone reductase-like Zn-dependent oxidoreductase
MFAVYAASFDPTDPLSGLAFGDRPDPTLPRDDWTTVSVRAASLNHHDLWTLRGVGLAPDELPRILGCDAAGVDADGNEVIVHSVISDPSWLGDETIDPKRSLLSERYEGTFAERVAVPRRNLIPKPATLSWEQAACLPTAWLTAYRMLFSQARLRPGDSVLVQGAGGGVATALIMLARAGGLRVFATSRDDDKRRRAESIGAHAAVETGARLPQRVDAVMETVGEATWSHSLKSLRPGGTLVISGATSGTKPANAELNRIFYLAMRVQGSTMGNRDELRELASFLDITGVRPLIDRTLPLDQARDGFAAMARGDLFGKVVLTL